MSQTENILLIMFRQWISFAFVIWTAEIQGFFFCFLDCITFNTGGENSGLIFNDTQFSKAGGTADLSQICLTCFNISVSLAFCSLSCLPKSFPLVCMDFLIASPVLCHLLRDRQLLACLYKSNTHKHTLKKRESSHSFYTTFPWGMSHATLWGKKHRQQTSFSLRGAHIHSVTTPLAPVSKHTHTQSTDFSVAVRWRERGR